MCGSSFQGSKKTSNELAQVMDPAPILYMSVDCAAYGCLYKLGVHFLAQIHDKTRLSKGSLSEVSFNVVSETLKLSWSGWPCGFEDVGSGPQVRLGPGAESWYDGETIIGSWHAYKIIEPDTTPTHTHTHHHTPHEVKIIVT